MRISHIGDCTKNIKSKRTTGHATITKGEQRVNFKDQAITTCGIQLPSSRKGISDLAIVWLWHYQRMNIIILSDNMHVQNWPRLLLMYWMKREGQRRTEQEKERWGPREADTVLGRGWGKRVPMILVESAFYLESSFCHSCFSIPLTSNIHKLISEKQQLRADKEFLRGTQRAYNLDFNSCW